MTTAMGRDSVCPQMGKTHKTVCFQVPIVPLETKGSDFFKWQSNFTL